MFSKLFGEKKKSSIQVGGGTSSSTTMKQSKEVVQTMNALEKLQLASDNLLKKKDYYHVRIENEVARAKECLRKNDKHGATMALKRKKMLLAKTEMLENNYLQIQEHILDLESLQTTTETFTAMKEAARAQKTAMSKHNVDKVEDMMADLTDAKQTMQEVQDAFESYGTLKDGIDEDELADELAAMEEEEFNEELLRPVEGISVSRRTEERIRTTAVKEEELPTVPKERPVRPSETRVGNASKEAEELLADLAL
ncbi:hypothetical protein M9435_003598 [Picochlorum sp. BPE23]|nr:hypothetical protein M9435_003598 [Picochlorum sp. BPE23]